MSLSEGSTPQARFNLLPGGKGQHSIMLTTETHIVMWPYIFSSGTFSTPSGDYVMYI